MSFALAVCGIIDTHVSVSSVLAHSNQCTQYCSFWNAQHYAIQHALFQSLHIATILATITIPIHASYQCSISCTIQDTHSKPDLCCHGGLLFERYFYQPSCATPRGLHL